MNDSCQLCGKYLPGDCDSVCDSCLALAQGRACPVDRDLNNNAALPGRAGESPCAGDDRLAGSNIRESRESRLTAPGTAPVHIYITRP